MYAYQGNTLNQEINQAVKDRAEEIRNDPELLKRLLAMRAAVHQATNSSELYKALELK